MLDAVRIIRPETLVRWPVFVVIGVGSPDLEVVARKSMRICAP
jgi:hypothetical protein